MKQDDLERRYAAADKPVNLRTAARHLAPSARAPGPALDKLRLAQRRHRFGAALVDVRRGTLGPTAARSRPDALTVAGSALAGGGAVALLFASLESVLWLRLAGIAGVTAGACWIGVRRFVLWRRARQAAAQEPAFDALDPASLQELDRLLETTAGEVPEDFCSQLVKLKETLAGIVSMWGKSSGDEHFTMEDRLFVSQCIARYLPDLLRSYLEIPAALRGSRPLSGGESALSVLRAQISLLQDDLVRREDRLSRSVGEGLLQQRRFLNARMKSR